MADGKFLMIFNDEYAQRKKKPYRKSLQLDFQIKILITINWNAIKKDLLAF